jgi:hypothetical protein
MRIHALLLAGVVATGTLGATATAATSGGPKPLAPTDGKALTAGRPFTFKVRDATPGSVFIKVSRSRKTKKDGTLRTEEWFRKMAKNGSVHTKKTDVYDELDDYFLNRPGTYYWQAYRIDCAAQEDCNVEGPIRRFRIR